MRTPLWWDATASGGTIARSRLKAAGGSAEFFAADCTSRKDLDSLTAHLAEVGRAADVLVNGAGVNAATPFLEITDEEWDRIINVNLRRSAWLARSWANTCSSEEHTARSSISLRFPQ